MASKKKVRAGYGSYKVCRGCKQDVISSEVVGIDGYNYCKRCAQQRGVMLGAKAIAKCEWCSTSSKKAIQVGRTYYCSKSCQKASSKHAELVALGGYAQGMQHSMGIGHNTQSYYSSSMSGSLPQRMQQPYYLNNMPETPSQRMGKRAPSQQIPFNTTPHSPFGSFNNEDEDEWEEDEDEEEWEDEDDEWDDEDEWEEDEEEDEWDEEEDDEDYEEEDEDYIDENEERASNAEALFDTIDTVTCAIGDAVGIVGGAVWKMVKNWR